MDAIRDRHLVTVILLLAGALIACLTITARVVEATATPVPAGNEATEDAAGLLARLAVQQAQLTASDGAADDCFGASVAIAGDTAVVGAAYHRVGASANQGSAYVFIRSGTNWTEQARLTASDGAAFDYFGGSVAISGDTIVVGAVGHDDGWEDLGAAYVFTRSGTTWSQEAQLTADDGAARDYFGSSVAISGDTVVVGAAHDRVDPNWRQGSAYIFTRSGTTWSAQAKLTASDGAVEDYFGSSVAVLDDTVLIGVPGDDVGANEDQGSAHVFTRSGTTWSQQTSLNARDGAAFDYFGGSVAISGGTALVGARSDVVGANEDQGSAHVFTRSGTTWSQQARLNARDGAAFDYFGDSVAISGDTALVGAGSDIAGARSNQGSAYVFTRSSTTWSQQARLTAGHGDARATFDGFGGGVAISGETAVVGARYDHVGANEYQGSAYVFAGVMAKPGKPVAKSPKGTISTRTPTFRWTAPVGAANYEVRVYRGSRLLTMKAGITKPWWKCTKRLPRGVDLTWKVRARNAAGAGPWSVKLRFKAR